MQHAADEWSHTCAAAAHINTRRLSQIKAKAAGVLIARGAHVASALLLSVLPACNVTSAMKDSTPVFCTKQFKPMM
jgi:hypothetical protein